MAQPKRRISYVIPPSTADVPHLQLPPRATSRLGTIGPLLIPNKDPTEKGPRLSQRKDNPKHRLGVASLALDTSTSLLDHPSPGGILYSGGRDGLVISWELGIPMKQRRTKGYASGLSSRRLARWEMITGWADEATDEENEEDERPQSDGDILGDVTGVGSRRRRRATTSTNEIPHEQQWEPDLDAFKPGIPSRFRQCAQLHSDWVNDVLLCNLNQTLVSASSDGTVKAWNPHASDASEPSLIGSHSDYVRCLTHCREQNWIASGSFDRTIKLWDLTKTSPADPIITLNPVDATAPKSSVYALAADPYGHLIASGSPERVIRLWDPRSGKRTGKLVGHTDNIRSILVSEDSRYLLTGSADASIKLWSLSSQRCLHTFAHHTESVWSLYSSHPSFETFYSGDRSGLVCKVDVEDCGDLSEGECLLLCHDSEDQGFTREGVNKIVAMDDCLLWTASGSSSIKRWRVPQRRAVRAAALVDNYDGDRSFSEDKKETSINSEGASPSLPRNTTSPSILSLASDNWMPQREREGESSLYGIPLPSLVRLTSPNDPFTPFSNSSRGRDPDVATLYSAASVMSVPRNGPRPQYAPRRSTSPIRSSRTVDTVHPQNTARMDYEIRELAADAKPLSVTPDDVIVGDHGLVRSVTLNDRMHALTVDTSGEVAVWDIVRGLCKGKFTREDVAAASHSGSAAGSNSSISGPKERSPREALEVVRERIEGEAVVAPWSTVATKTGVLTVDLGERCFESEVYADEVGYANDRHFNDESRLNLGKWVLRNLFLGFIQEEQHMQRARNAGDQDRGLGESHRSSGESIALSNSPPRSISSRSLRPSRHGSTSSRLVTHAHRMVPAVIPNVSTPSRSSPLITPMIPLSSIIKDDNPTPLPPIPQTPGAPTDATPVPGSRRVRAGTLDGTTTAPSLPTSSKDDYFSVRKRQGSVSAAAPPTPDDFSGWGGPGKPNANNGGHVDSLTPLPLTPGGLMGRMMKGFGKGGKKPTGETSSGSSAAVTIAENTVVPPEDIAPEPDGVKTPLQILLSTPFSPPTSADAPRLHFPSNAHVIISEEGSPTLLYRGTVGTTGHDMHLLEDVMPMWLLEYLLLNKAPEIPLAKLSFVLLPWNKDPSAEPLPELLNTQQSKLTASRFLRVRKLIIHVQDKIDKLTNSSQKASNGSRSSSESTVSQKELRPKAEDLYEILCNDVLLPLDMCIAAVRQLFLLHLAGSLPMSLNMTDNYTLGAVAITFCAATIAHIISKKNPAPLPPGPRGLPIIGCVADLPKNQPWLGFAKLGEKHGGILYMPVMGKDIIILNDPQYATEMLDRKSKVYSDRPKLVMAGDLVGWGEGPALIPFGKTWSEYRRLFTQFIGSRAKIDEFSDVLLKETHNFLKATVIKPEKWVDHAFGFAGAIVLSLAYGYEAVTREDALVGVVNEAMDQFSETTMTGAFAVDIFPSLLYVPEWFPGTEWKRKARHYRKTLKDMLDMPYNWTKSQLSKGTARHSFVASQLTKPVSAEEERVIKWAAAGIYSGGADTTVAGIECIFLAMTLHIEQQQHAQDELDTVLGHGVLPTLADRSRLPYVEALFLEILRSYSFGPLGLPHVASEDDIHDGYFIPKGTMIITNIWQFLHNPDSHPDPHAFKPERYLVTPDHPVRESDPRDYIYGFGRRLCPGTHLADASMWILFACVLASFDIRPPMKDGQSVLPSGRFLDGSISHPEPFECSIKPRSATVLTAIRTA